MNQLQAQAAELLRGAYDLHVHSAPDVLPRKLNDIEMAQRGAARGMAGFVIKSHYFCSAQRAELVNEMGLSCRAYGSIALNMAVGGINPIAVEMAARAGARVVWFPTCDARWEQEQAAKEIDPARKPFWVKVVDQLQADGIQTPTLSILEDDRLSSAAHEVLEVAARNKLAVATGHISHAETFALARAAKEHKVDRLIVTHVNFPSTFYTIDEQWELAACGAMLEHCYTTYATGKVPLEVMLEQIRALGPNQVVLGTDLGQKIRPYPDEGMAAFIEDLLRGGFSAQDIHRMAAQNSAALLGEPGEA